MIEIQTEKLFFQSEKIEEIEIMRGKNNKAHRKDDSRGEMQKRMKCKRENGGNKIMKEIRQEKSSEMKDMNYKLQNNY